MDGLKDFMDNTKTNVAFYILIVLVLYLPFQSYLAIPSIGGGVNLLNFLLLLLFLTSAGNAMLPSRSYNFAKTIVITFLIWSVVAALMNIGTTDISTAIVEWKRFFLISLLFPMTYRVLRNESEIRTVLTAICFIVVLVAIQQLRNTYEFRDANYNDSMRFGGVFGRGGENDVASFLAINAMWFLFWSKEIKKFSRLLPLACLFLTALACLFGFSRAGYISFAVGALWYGFYRNRTILIILLIAVVSVPVWAPEPVKDRMFMLQSDKVDKDASSQMRLELWTGAKQMIANNIVFGVGPGNFNRQIDNYVNIQKDHPRASHNMYLRYAAETGIFGLILFLLILVIFLREGRSLMTKYDDWRKTFGVAYAATICAIIVINFFGDRFLREELTGYIWLTSAIAFKIQALPTRNVEELPPDASLQG